MQCYFFRFLLGFLYNLAGFQSNIKEVQEKFPAEFSMFLRAKPHILWVLTLTYDVNKNFYVCQCGKQIRITGIFSVEKIFLHENCRNRQYLLLYKDEIWEVGRVRGLEPPTKSKLHVLKSTEETKGSPRLSRLDKFTWLWALKHKQFVTPSADHWTFLLVPKRDMSFLVGVFEENPDSYSG